MRLNQYGWHHSFFNKVGSFPFSSWVLVLTDISKRPSVKCTFFDRGHIIGNELISDKIALLNGGPKLVSRRIERQSNRVPSSRSEQSVSGAVRIEFGDRRSQRFLTGI